MAATQNGTRPSLFLAYAAGVGALYLGLPRLLGLRYTMPWDYWWVFLVVTPAAAALALGPGVRAGRFSGWAVGLFYLAAVTLGLWPGWFSYQPSGVV